MNLSFADVQITPRLSDIESRKNVDLSVIYKTPISKRTLQCIPIIASNMDAVGTFQMCRSLGKLDCLTALHKYYPVGDFKKSLMDYWQTYDETKNISGMLHNGFYLQQKWFITVGIKDEDFQFLEGVSNIDNHMVCIDVANGYISKFHNFITKIRSRWPNAIIMAGNVCTPDGVKEVYKAGADIVKIGIGTSQFCRTSQVTGIGKKSFSTIKDCRDYVYNEEGSRPLLCLDGGCREPGDVCKAFGAGADFVMLGTLLAGTDECSGSWEYDYQSGTKKSLKVYGMSSKEAMEKYNNYKDYRASEGITMKITHKGPVAGVMNEILGGLRSACAYTNHRKLETFINNVNFTY